MSVNAEQSARTPDNFMFAELLALDFDGTVAETYDKSPGDIGIHEAHELAIDALYGVRKLQYFRDNGGLRGRAPIQVVKDLQPDLRGGGAELDAEVDRFVATKLSVLMGEVGTRFPDGSVWPRPTPGYLGLHQKLHKAREEGRLIDNLILSSGHRAFIEKTYRAWGVSQPDFIVAEETIRQMDLGLPHEQLVKPSPVLMNVAKNVWREGYSLEPTPELSPVDQWVIVYVGDDRDMDAPLARNSGVDFFLISHATSNTVWQLISERLQIDSLATQRPGQDGR